MRGKGLRVDSFFFLHVDIELFQYHFFEKTNFPAVYSPSVCVSRSVVSNFL